MHIELVKQIEIWPINALVPYEKNAKIHSREQVGEIATAIKKFGFLVPILVNKTDSMIAAGHGRLEAAKLLGIEEVPVIAVSHLSDELVRAFRLADNRIPQNARYDMDVMKNELAELAELGIELSDMGFSFDEIRGLADDDEEGEGDDDSEGESDAQNAPAAKRVALGDVWAIGEHRLVCGDSTDPAVVSALMLDETADIVLTDPPYEMQHETLARALANQRAEHYVVICTFRQAAKLALADDIVFHFDFVLDAKVPKSFMNSRQPYFVHQNGIYISKNDSTLFDCKHAQGKFSDGAYWPTIISAPRSTSAAHGHAKNVKALEAILSGFACEKVVDPFCGGGSVMAACENTHRRCFAFELIEEHCDAILERMEKMTGYTAFKEHNIHEKQG